MPDRTGDPLESMLREALRDEAARTDIVVDAAMVEARWRANQTRVDRRRRLLAAVATIAVVVVGSLVAFRPGPLGVVAGSPAASVAVRPSAQPLPSIDAPPGTVIDAGDAPANATATGPIEIGAIDRIGFLYTFFVACQGPGTLSITSSGVIEPPLTPVPCDGAIATRDLTLQTDEATTLFVSREPGTRWHVVVMSYELANPSPSLEPRRHLATAADGVPRSDTAIFVREGAADTIDVVAVASDGSERPVASIPGGALPDGTIALAEADVSDLGWLAIPISTDATDAAGIIAVVDLYDPTAPAWIIDSVNALDARSMAWSPTGWLAYVGSEGNPYLAYEGSYMSGPFGSDISALDVGLGHDRFTWTADGAGLMASRTSGSGKELGVMTTGGRFTPGLPPTFQMTGRGRITGADGTTLGILCDDGPTPSASGCFVTLLEAAGDTTTWYPGDLGGPPLAAAFAATGDEIWVLAGPVGDGRAAIVSVTSPGVSDTGIELPLMDPSRVPSFVGLSADDTVIAVGDGGQTILVRTDSNSSRAVDGAFAGWEAGATYPAP